MFEEWEEIRMRQTNRMFVYKIRIRSENGHRYCITLFITRHHNRKNALHYDRIRTLPWKRSCLTTTAISAYLL